MPIINQIVKGSGGGSSVIDPLNVTPSTSAQTITASGGTDGYSPVNVSAVDASIDANITAGNIKDGVSILGVTGNVVERNATFLTITPMTVQQITRPTSPYNAFEWVTVDAVDASIDANITAGNIKSGVTILGVTGNVVELNGETKTVTPQVYGQTLYPTAPKNGITEITVNAVTSSIDANITAGNIKKDVSILGVTGTYEGTTPTGTITITSNGITDVTNYASADVQVPTTAPALYREFQIDNGILGPNTTTTKVIDFTGITEVQDGLFSRLYTGNTNIAIHNLDLSAITRIWSYSFYQAFKGCTGITGKVITPRAEFTSNYMFFEMFRDCTGITEAEFYINVSASGLSGYQYVFVNCTGITKAKITGGQIGSSNTAGSIAGHLFEDCTSLADLDVSEVYSVSGSTTGGGLVLAFAGCTALKNAVFSSLNKIGNYGMQQTFKNSSNLENLYFPSISSGSFMNNNKTAFYSMLQGVNNCTLHFPSNVQSLIEGLTGYSTTAPFGATAGTVLFDLPATNTLTGANSVTYTRNPKYDTATALAWKVGAYGTTNFTPAYYTSGTTNPSVGNTIYSDAACTTPVTTISSIA